MTPIDRVAQRAQAFTVLGVAASATWEDIRSAYRELAFDKHPDRNPNGTAEFARIAEAYKFITEHAAELGIKPASPAANANESDMQNTRPISRPRIRASETRFDQATMKECYEMLDEYGGSGEHHAATVIFQRGRSLTYFVPSPVAPGRNEVVVPTGMLTDSRYVLPKIVAFDSAEVVNGQFEMDLEDCREHFPGARAIKIRFAQA